MRFLALEFVDSFFRGIMQRLNFVEHALGSSIPESHQVSSLQWATPASYACFTLRYTFPELTGEKHC